MSLSLVMLLAAGFSPHIGDEHSAVQKIPQDSGVASDDAEIDEGPFRPNSTDSLSPDTGIDWLTPETEIDVEPSNSSNSTVKPSWANLSGGKYDVRTCCGGNERSRTGQTVLYAPNGVQGLGVFWLASAACGANRRGRPPTTFAPFYDHPTAGRVRNCAQCNGGRTRTRLYNVCFGTSSNRMCCCSDGRQCGFGDAFTVW